MVDMISLPASTVVSAEPAAEPEAEPEAAEPAELPEDASDFAKFEVIVNNALKLLTFDAFCDIIKE